MTAHLDERKKGKNHGTLLFTAHPLSEREKEVRNDEISGICH
jgi:hypothetical protein